MNEIDFIPEWYKAGRVRKRKNVRHTALIMTLFVIMVGWSLIIGQHVQHVAAEVEDVQDAFKKSKVFVVRAQELNDEIAALKQKSTLLDRVTPRTKVTSIIGELSYLIQDEIVISKLILKYEPITEVGKEPGSASKALIQTTGNKKNEDVVVPEVSSRLKVLLTGVASKPSAAASLIARLENTQYFEQVALVFSKPKTVREQNVTEFEISCIVSDYRICKSEELQNEI